MQGGRYGRKYRIKPRFYLILLVAVSLLAWGVLAVSGLFRSARVEWGRLESNEAITAIVLRDEKLVESTEYAKLTCVAAEGEEVKKDDPVALLYLTGYSPTDLENLLIQEDKIKDYQENNILKDFVNKDLDALNSKIDDLMEQISTKAAARQTQSLLADERQLQEYMDERKEYMEKAVTPDDMLETYYQQRDNLEDKIAQTRKSVTAPADGLVSFYLDGYESTLTVDSIEKMTPANVKELLRSLQSQSQAVKSDDVVEPDEEICRVVDPSVWYAVVLLPKGESSLVEGNTCDVTFDGMSDPVTATVKKVETQGRTTLVVFQMPAGVQQMISLRLINGHLGADVEGFRIPVQYLGKDGDQYFVTVRASSGKARQIAVNLLGQDDQYAIVSESGEEGALSLGMQLVKPSGD